MQDDGNEPGQKKQARVWPAVAFVRAQCAAKTGTCNIGSGDGAKRAVQRYAQKTAGDGHSLPVGLEPRQVQKIFERREPQPNRGAIDDAIHRFIKIAYPPRYEGDD